MFRGSTFASAACTSALLVAGLLAGCASSASSGQAGLANAPRWNLITDPAAHDSIGNGAEGCGAGATRPAPRTVEAIRRERIQERRRARGEDTDLDEGIGGSSAMCNGVGRIARGNGKTPAPITYLP